MVKKAKTVEFMNRYFISLEEGIDIKNVAAQVDTLVESRNGGITK